MLITLILSIKIIRIKFVNCTTEEKYPPYFHECKAANNMSSKFLPISKLIIGKFIYIQKRNEARNIISDSQMVV
jgi:hypothetical protein